MFDASRYTIGWICALPVELMAARLHLDKKHDSSEYEPEPKDDNTYVFGSIGKHDIVVATLPRGQYGTSKATSVAQDLIRSFTNVRIGLMVGIGGGAPLMEEDEKRDIRLGDVVVSVPGNGHGGVHQYDYGKDIQDEPFQLTGHLSPPPKSILGAVTVLGTDFEEDGHGIDESVTAILANRTAKLRKQYARPDAASDRLYKSTFIHLTKEKDCSIICKNDDELVRRAVRADDEENVVIHYGLIASGNTLMKNAVVRNRSARQFGVLCFEMEAAGLMDQFPFLVVRGICDYSDTHKNKEWQGYAAMTAAAYVKKLLLRLAPSKVERENKLSELKEIKDSLNEMKSGVVSMHSHLIQHTTRTLRADIAQWLAPPDADTDFQTALLLREPGTGSWLVQSDAYLQWKSNTIKNLWLHGKAGCGKSVISATIIEDIQRYCAEDTDSGYAYFYFSFSDKSKQSRLDCVRSIIWQLSGDRSVSEALEGLHKACTDRSQGSSSMENNLQNVLVNGVRLRKRFFLILDALDEIPNTMIHNTKPREEVLNWLNDLSEILPTIQILTTSRPLIDIEERLVAGEFHPESMISGCIDIDIRQWVVGQMNSDPILRKLSALLKQEAEDTFKQKADGMFRWAYCQMSELRALESTQPSDFRQALESLPATLDETYTRMITKIHPNLQEKALNLLRWLTYSARPLSIRELSETRIITLDGENSSVDTHDRGDPEDVLRILSDLIIVIPSEQMISQDEVLHDQHTYIPDDPDASKSVRLAHYSVQEYFESSRDSPGRHYRFRFQPVAEQQFLSHCCVVYLMHYATNGTATRTVQDLQIFPLLQYAARTWFEHCQETDDVTQEVQFLQSDTALKAWAVLHDPSRRRLRPFQIESDNTERASGLYFSTFCGLRIVTKGLLDAGADVNAQYGYYGSPLQAAASRGHESIIKMLIEAGADINAQGGHYGTALQAAARNGHESIIKMLIEAGVDINAEVGDYSTALQAAAWEEHESIIKMLIEAGADVNAQGGVYGTALAAAASRGRKSIIKMLNEAGADLNAQGGYYGTALAAAVSRGHESIVKMLIEDCGADINAQGGAYGTALHLAAYQGHESIVKMLVEDYGADINSQGGVYGTALQTAAYQGHESIVKMLIEDYGADINAQGGVYGTALAAASFRGYESIIKMLIDAGTELNSIRVSSSGLGAKGNLTVIFEEMSGADVNQSDEEGGTILRHAAREGLPAFLT